MQHDARTRQQRFMACLQVWNDDTARLATLVEEGKKRSFPHYGALWHAKNQAVLYFKNASGEPSPEIARREYRDYMELAEALAIGATRAEVAGTLGLTDEADLVNIYNTLSQWFRGLSKNDHDFYLRNGAEQLPPLPAATVPQQPAPYILRTPARKKPSRPGAAIVPGRKLRDASEVAHYVLQKAWARARSIPTPNNKAVIEQVELNACARTGLPFDWRLGKGAKNLPLTPMLVPSPGRDQIDAQAQVVVRIASLTGFVNWPLPVLDAAAVYWARHNGVLADDIDPSTYAAAVTVSGGKELSINEVAGLLFSRAVEKASSRGLSASGLTYPHVAAGVLAGFCPVLGMKFDHREQLPGSMQNPWRASLDRVRNDKDYSDGNTEIISNFANKVKGVWSMEELKWMLAGRAETLGVLAPGVNARNYQPPSTEEYMPDV